MTRDEATIGMRVIFGRDGEETLGKIVKLHPARAKVVVLKETSGRATGTRWNVPYHLMRSAEDEQSPTT